MISRASLIGDLENMLKTAGFEKIDIAPIEKSKSLIGEWMPQSNVYDFIVSVTIEAVKP